MDSDCSVNRKQRKLHRRTERTECHVNGDNVNNDKLVDEKHDYASEGAKTASELISIGSIDNNLIDDETDWLHGDPIIEDDHVDENVTDTGSAAFRRRMSRKNRRPQTTKEKFQSNLTVIAAVAAGVIVSIVKGIASAITGSTALMAEAAHSLVDACNDSLLLVGTRASQKPADTKHPFGYGQLMYFYTFVVGVVIFAFGGGFTIYTGFESLLSTEHELTNPILNYIVLAVGIVIESMSLRIALRDVNSARGEKTLKEYIRESKSTSGFTVLLEDSAAVIGMIIALAGITLSYTTGYAEYDAIASMLVGIVMASVAVVLLREARSLLIGEGLSMDEINDVVHIVESDPGVIKCGRVLSMYLGPKDMLLTLDVTFDDELDEGDVLRSIDRIEGSILHDYPQCTSIFIEAESLNQVYRQRLDRKHAFQQATMDDE